MKSNKNILLCIAYDGTDFCGYQKQKEDRTVQGVLEYALSTLLQEEVVTYSAGRTDAGVHAVRQYVHFLKKSENISIPIDKISKALNSILPADIRVYWSREVPLDFHARYSAVRRAYYYQLYEGDILPPALRRYYLLVKQGIDWELLKKDLEAFLGEHDFSAVSSKNQQVNNYVRTVTRVDIIDDYPIKKIYIEANAFLWKMVRSIVGTVVTRAEHRLSKYKSSEIAEMSIKEILESKDRLLAGATAVPWGLFLYDVQYKEEYGIETRIRTRSTSNS